MSSRGVTSPELVEGNDEAIQKRGLLRYARNDGKRQQISTSTLFLQKQEQ